MKDVLHLGLSGADGRLLPPAGPRSEAMGTFSEASSASGGNGWNGGVTVRAGGRNAPAPYRSRFWERPHTEPGPEGTPVASWRRGVERIEAIRVAG